MNEFTSIEDLAKNIKYTLDAVSTKKKIVALYAFNATGKTRLTTMLEELGNTHEDEGDAVKVLSYNAFFEDIFVWDNDSYFFTFHPGFWIFQLIIEQGLEYQIVENFKEVIRSPIEPSFDFKEGKVTFNIVSGDDSSETNIKISRGEESIFVWSIFYTVLEAALDALSTDQNRTTQIFNDLQYVIIDDPVSSIDDTKIITMAVTLTHLIANSQNNQLKFFITTHHALFFNILVNSFNSRDNKDYGFTPYSLYKNNQAFILSKQGDSPFSYHLSLKELIQDAINNDSIEKYHFNLFRSLLEKTSNFLGYNNWDMCIEGTNKQEFTRLLNFYSHSRLSDIENKELSNEDKIIFQETFEIFMRDFKWNGK